MKITVYIVYGVSQALYKLFGYNTKVRKAWIKQEAYRLQKQLDYEHYIKERINTATNGVYTTKEAMKIADTNNWL